MAVCLAGFGLSLADVVKYVMLVLTSHQQVFEVTVVSSLLLVVDVIDVFDNILGPVLLASEANPYVFFVDAALPVRQSVVEGRGKHLAELD